MLRCLDCYSSSRHRKTTFTPTVVSTCISNRKFRKGALVGPELLIYFKMFQTKLFSGGNAAVGLIISLDGLFLVHSSLHSASFPVDLAVCTFYWVL